MFMRADEARPAKTRVEIFPAPSRGWMQSGNIVTAPRDAAEVLDNFIPTAQGVRLRGGATEYADCGAAVVRLMHYASSGAEDFFGATAGSVFDLERLNGGSNAFAEIEGLGSGDWSATQISTSGGQFLVAVNGTDYGMYWDGSDWNPITTVAVNEVSFDAETGAFSVDDTLAGGTSGASAPIYMIRKTSATEGVLKIGTVASGPFQDNEALTDGTTGAATAASANSAASTITITNVSTKALSHVNLFKRRLFFVEENTTSAWYLPVNSIGGAAAEFDFGPLFRKGGSLLFTATWSLDSGDGLDDVFLAVSDQGEIAVYQGTDPATAADWVLSGVYEIAKPLNKHAYFKAGGDLAILTEDGIIPVSEALRKERGALQANALTYAIEDAWKAAIANRTAAYPISATLWQAQTLLLVGTPQTDNGRQVSFVANARTGAWARITGWDVRCGATFGDELYFGTGTGKVLKADSGGNDDGMDYVAVCVPKFSTARGRRGAVTAGITYKAREPLNFDMYAHADYQVDYMANPVPAATESPSTWGTGVWGTFVWGGDGDLNSYTEWQQVRATGYALAPAVVIASNQTSLLEYEIQALRLRAEEGYEL